MLHYLFCGEIGLRVIDTALVQTDRGTELDGGREGRDGHKTRSNNLSLWSKRPISHETVLRTHTHTHICFCNMVGISHSLLLLLLYKAKLLEPHLLMTHLETFRYYLSLYEAVFIEVGLQVLL